MRAEPLLRSRLKAPRKERLSQVLATLQPEQYRLITAPASDSIIIEGGPPGTGKTIIASHRAAYFIHDDPQHPPDHMRRRHHPHRPPHPLSTASMSARSYTS